DEHRDLILASLARGQTPPELPESIIVPNLDNTWHDTAEAVINNWIGKVYQLTNIDRKSPFTPGIDPNDPLQLRIAQD
ncbi:MAG TPA: hypothetical protein VI565_06455, partial [Burkholderiales bacterium]|nr:hypothetical protein [Burkholderiales bacterium]